jgi:hypothetical protein
MGIVYVLPQKIITTQPISPIIDAEGHGICDLFGFTSSVATDAALTSATIDSGIAVPPVIFNSRVMKPMFECAGSTVYVREPVIAVVVIALVAQKREAADPGASLSLEAISVIPTERPTHRASRVGGS